MRRLGFILLVSFSLAVVAPAQAKPKLKRFNSCGQLVDYATSHMDGFRPGGPPAGPQRVPAPMPTSPDGGEGTGGQPLPPQGAPGAPAPAAGQDGDFSLTNNQEAGVFEPDIIKTDGRYVYSLSGGTLRVTDGRAAPPQQVGKLALGGLGYDEQMLLYRDRLLIAGTGEFNSTAMWLVDVSDPAQPKLLRTLAVVGNLLSMRRTEQTIRVVLNATPRYYSGPQQVDPETPRAWVPTGVFKRVRSGRTSTRRLVPCTAVRRPKAFTGLESLTVLTLDMTRGLDPIDTDAVMTSGQTVYASARNLYVATHRYQPGVMERFSGPVPENETTQIHRFSLDDAASTTYRGSGQVPGYLLNQFSLSEQGGVLRTATTETPPWFGSAPQESQSFVTTLAVRGDRLAPLGQVGGMGRGERIYAVRFLGDVGYVVTFRQVDPLYTVDLADPAAPRVRGELKIPGFSSYLQPIGDGKLIGIGQGPNEDETARGLQLSLFDVSNLDNPLLQQRTTIANGSSEAEYDHHAFLWWAPDDLAVMPIRQYGGSSCCATGGPEPMPMPRSTVPAPQDHFNGAIAFTVRPDAIAEAGRIVHATATSVRRTIVMGERLITLSDAGIGATAMNGFGDLGFSAF